MDRRILSLLKSWRRVEALLLCSRLFFAFVVCNLVLASELLPLYRTSFCVYSAGV